MWWSNILIHGMTPFRRGGYGFPQLPTHPCTYGGDSVVVNTPRCDRGNTGSNPVRHPTCFGAVA